MPYRKDSHDAIVAAAAAVSVVMIVNVAEVGDSCGCATVPRNIVDVAAKRTCVGKSVARRQTPAHIITQTAGLQCFPST